MKTRVIEVSRDREAAIAEAASILTRGGLVAFPTETVYGLGALGLHTDALKKVFEAKERPVEDPLILHVADTSWLDRLAKTVPVLVRRLVERFWPGPLTVILSKSEIVPSLATAGLPSVAVRMPAHPLALALISAVGSPLAAPSANRFGRSSPTTARHVLSDLDGRIEAVLDAGPTEVGVESTVIDARRASGPVILRPGGIPREAIEEVLGAQVPLLEGHPAVEAEPTVSPGLLARHYSPRAKLRLFRGSAERMPRRMRAEIEARARDEGGKRCGVLAYEEDLESLAGLSVRVETLGPRRGPEQVARRLFAAMRALDEAGVDVIFSRLMPPGGLGETINDRLTRAAAGRLEEDEGAS